MFAVPPAFDRFACGTSQVFPVASDWEQDAGCSTKRHHGAMAEPPAPADGAPDKETSRLEAFSDGVLAVIITITAFGLRAPAGGSFGALGHRLPALLIYVLSFVFIGIYWNNHHHLLRATTRVSGAVMWANLHLLFWLSLIPVVTGWVGGPRLQGRESARQRPQIAAIDGGLRGVDRPRALTTTRRPILPTNVPFDLAPTDAERRYLAKRLAEV